jgi:hypothetical protein
MIGTRGHDASVAEKGTFSAFNCPATETMLTVCHCIAVKLCIAFLPTDRSSVVMHHRRVSVHGGKRVAVSIRPTAKAHARRGDDHSDIIHSLGSKGGLRNSRNMQQPKSLMISGTIQIHRKTILKTPGLDAKGRFRPFADLGDTADRQVNVALITPAHRCCHRFVANAVRLQLHALVHNSPCTPFSRFAVCVM